MYKRDQGWDFLISSDKEIDPDGQFYRNADGSGTYYGANGSTGYINADGSGTYYATDGSTGYIQSDGSATYYGKDGSTEYVKSDGSSTYYGADGSIGYIQSDGSATYYGKDGSTEYIKADGSSTYYNRSNENSKYANENEDIYIDDDIDDDEEDAEDNNKSRSFSGIGLGMGLAAMAAVSSYIHGPGYYTDEEGYETEYIDDTPNYTSNRSLGFFDIIDFIKEVIHIVWKWIKRILKGVVIICVFSVALYAYDSWSSKEEEEIDNRIVIGISSTEAIGQDYESIEEQLEDAGFSYVVSYGMNDLDYSERSKEGIIGKIEVDGEEAFSSTAKYDKDVSIVVKYHSLKTAYPPMTSSEAKKQNYEEVVDAFKNAGFGNIKLTQEKDLLTGWVTKDGSVESISINSDNEYKTTSLFRVDTEVTITYHTFKK